MCLLICCARKPVLKMLTEHPRPRLLILDLDNCLWDWVAYFGAGIESQVKFIADSVGHTREGVYEAFKRAHAHLGCTEHPDASYYAIRSLADEASDNPAGLARARELALLSRERFLLAALPKLALYEWTKATVVAIQALNIRVIGFTDALRPNADFRLAATGLYLDGLSALNALSTKSDHKPSTSRLHRIADAEGVHPSQCVVVGDNPSKDIQGANDAGMISVLAAYGQVKPCRELDEVHKVTSWSPSDIAAQHAPVKAGFTANCFSDIFHIMRELGAK